MGALLLGSYITISGSRVVSSARVYGSINRDRPGDLKRKFCRRPVSHMRKLFESKTRSGVGSKDKRCINPFH